MARLYELMSSDGHLEMPPERWTHRVPAKYRDRAPKSVVLPDGSDGMIIEGQPLREANFLDLRAGRATGQWQPFGLTVEGAAGLGPPEQRVQEQDQDGLEAEVLFPAMVVGPSFWRNITHDEVFRAMVRAYNDWLGEEYCPGDPDRLLGMGIIPMTNLNDAIEELYHIQKLGLKGIVMTSFPNGNAYPKPEDDKFWAAAVEMGMPISVHVTFDRNNARANQPTFIYPKNDPETLRKVRRPILEWMCNFGLPPAVGITQLIFSGAFDRFPDLKVFFAETRLGWVPFWTEHADLWYHRHIGWAEEQLGFKPLKRLPSEYVRDHIYFSVQYENVAVELRHHIGVDHIMFATDFPHIECEWPDTKPIVERIYANVPEDERHLMWAGNCINYFKLEQTAKTKVKA